MKETTTTNEGKYQIDKAIFIQQETGGYFNNGGFFVAFSGAMKEIATNKNLNKLDVRLLMLILSYMGVREMMISPNVQFLMGVADYAEELGNSKQHISASFKKMEELGYIKRDKKKNSIHILINPDMVYNGKNKNYSKVWNQSDDDFEQNFSSLLLDDLQAKSND